MKIVSSLYLILQLFQGAYASAPIESCGEFKALGEIMKNKDETGYSLIVNSNTKSQYDLKVKLNQELQVSSHLGKRVLMTFTMQHPSNGMRGQIDKVISIKKIPFEGIETSKKNELELVLKSECIK